MPKFGGPTITTPCKPVNQDQFVLHVLEEAAKLDKTELDKIIAVHWT